jgi:subtilase family serine protease
MTRRRRLATRPRLERLDQRLVLSTLTPAQLDSAYGLNSITFSNGTVQGDGAGETIALIDAYHDPNIYGDLVAFDAKNGLVNPYLTPILPAPSPNGTARPAFSMVNFAGAATNSGWAVEESLDAEAAHAAAPLANIEMVEARSGGVLDMLDAIDAVKTLPSVTVISISWGGPEFQGQQAMDSVFTTPIGHQGITFLASSGDDGAGAQWPASSANVVGVGGTTLGVDTAGLRASESAWSGSGGAISQVVSKPAYQSSAVSGSFRGSPDVSSDANPNSGMVIVSQGSQMQVGGTSMAAPMWAGLIAIADQGLALAGKPALDGPSQTLPDLYNAPAGSFFDVTTGSRAAAGYDTSTGLGSPNAAALVGFLDKGTSIATPSRTNTGATGGSGSGTTTKGTGGGTSPAIAFPDPNPTLPSTSQPAASGAPAPAAPEFVANLVAVGLPTTSLDPKATDAVLDGWDGLGLSAVRRLSATNPRG